MAPTGRRSSPSSSPTGTTIAAPATSTDTVPVQVQAEDTPVAAAETGVVAVVACTGTTAANHSSTLKRQYKETLVTCSSNSISLTNTNKRPNCADDVVTKHNSTASTNSNHHSDEHNDHNDDTIRIAVVGEVIEEVILDDDDNEELIYPDEVYNCINRVNNYNAHLDEKEISDLHGFVNIYDIEQEQQYEDDDEKNNTKGSLNVTINTTWGHTGICNRRKVIGSANSTTYLLPFLVPIEHQKQLQQQFQRLSSSAISNKQQQQENQQQQPISLFQLFEYLFPIDFIKTIIIPNINKKLSARRAKIVHSDANHDDEKHNHQFSATAADGHDDDITNIWDVTYGEFIRFIGLFFAISTYVGIEPYQFWSTEPITPFHGAPIRFHMYMAWVRFEEIFYSLPSSFCTSMALLSDTIDIDKYNSIKAPSISTTTGTTNTTNTGKNTKTNTVTSTSTNSSKTTTTTTTSSSTNCIHNDDKFVHVREMIESFNTNMENNFVSGWISATGTSIMPWTSRQQNTCPGFVYNTKQSLFGNCFHTICCGTSGILYSIDLDERITKQQGQRDNSSSSTAVDHISRLTKSLQSTGKVVILNSNYGGFHGVKELLDKGIFASGKITKKDLNGYGDYSSSKNSKLQWPSHIDGDIIQDHFSTVPVGTYDSIGGTFHSSIGTSPIDNSDYSLTLKKSFDIYCLKKGTSNISMVLSSYGTNNTPSLPSSSSTSNNDESKFSEYDSYYYIDTNTGKKVTYTPSEVVYYYDKYINTVDRHNNKRLHTSTSSFEFRWGTDNWERRVFAFLLAITEVNIMLADRYFNNIDNKTSEATTNADVQSKDKRHQAKNQYEFRQQLALALIENPYYDDSDIGEEEHQHCHHRHHHHDQPCSVHSSSNPIDTSQSAANIGNSNSRRRGRHTSNADLHSPATTSTSRNDTPLDTNHSHEVASTSTTTTATAAAALASIGGTGSDDNNNNTNNSIIVHELLTIPRGHKFSKEGGGQQLVLAKSDYPQRPCVGCKKKVRTYCRCTPGTLLCNECYCAHNIETRQRQQQQLLLQQQHHQQQQQQQPAKKQCRPAGAPSYEA